MKVFEVITEHCSDDAKEIRRQAQYVTAEDNSFKTVVDYFTTHCEQYEEDLIGVREIIVIVQHIKE